jgi:HSP20 family protein
MALGFADPFSALLRFQNALDSLRTSGWLDAGPSASGAYPPINVFREGDDVVLIAEVPGIKKSDLSIEVKGRTIRIAGSKSLTVGDKASLHRRERQAGTFDRALTVPVELDAEKARAECHDGILALWLPRAEHDKAKSIPITS